MKKAVAFLQSLREQALTRKMYESNFIFNGYTIHIMSQPAIAKNIQRGGNILQQEAMESFAFPMKLELY